MREDDQIRELGGKEHFKREAQPCLECGALGNCDTSVTDEEPPRPGDATVCYYCGAIMKFGPNLELMALDSVELEEIKAEQPDVYETLTTLQAQIRQLAKLRGH